MPIKIKVSDEKLLSLVDEPVAQAFIDAKVSLVIAHNSVTLVQDGEAVKEEKFAPVALSLFKQGVLGDHQFASFSASLLGMLQSVAPSDAVDEALDSTIPAAGAHFDDPEQEGVIGKHSGVEFKTATASNVQVAPVTTTKATKATKGTKPPFFSTADDISIEKIMEKYPVLLNSATDMYQPVKGTGGGSRYFVVAQSEKYLVAARCKSGKISIRLEPRKGGSITSPMQSILSECGFDVHGDVYASVHMEAKSKLWARKILGSMLLSTGILFATPMPRVDLIYGKGN